MIENGQDDLLDLDRMTRRASSNEDGLNEAYEGERPTRSSDDERINAAVKKVVEALPSLKVLHLDFGGTRVSKFPEEEVETAWESSVKWMNFVEEREWKRRRSWEGAERLG